MLTLPKILSYDLPVPNIICYPLLIILLDNRYYFDSSSSHSYLDIFEI